MWASNGGDTLIWGGVHVWCVSVCVEKGWDGKEGLASDLITHFLKEETEPALVPAFK